MHHIYETEGFVLSRRASGEAGYFLNIFSKDLGLVRAEASGSRKISSKLRYSIQDFSLSKFSLVRGKNTWKLTGVYLLSDYSVKFKNEKEKIRLVARIFSVLKRLIHGEEKNEKLFILIDKALLKLSSRVFSKEEINSIEILFLFRVMSVLGYGDGKIKSKNISDLDYWDEETLSECLSNKKEIISAINRSLKESQL